MFTIRDFDGSDADYEALVAIDTAVFGEYPMTADQWRHIDTTRDPELPFHRNMIEQDGQVVAMGDYGQTKYAFHPRKFVFNVYVHPDHEHPAIRPLYLQHVLETLADRQPIAFTTGMLEDRTTHIDFLHNAGFVEVMRSPFSGLDVTTFDDSTVARHADRITQAGIRIVSLRALSEIDLDWKRKFHDLYWELSDDVPSSDPPVKDSLEEFEAGTLNAPHFDHDGCFVALDGDRYVGMSHVWINLVNKDQLHSGLTGVVRSHRRQGIATVLKLHQVAFARQIGASLITTSNEENNPMYHLNLALGFTPRPGWVTFEKSLQPDRGVVHPTE